MQDIPTNNRHVGLRHIIPNPRVILNLFQDLINGVSNQRLDTTPVRFRNEFGMTAGHWNTWDARKAAFSLVELLMALLVASLLMAALAPVMTKRVSDSTTVFFEGTIPGKKTKTHEIEFNSIECNTIRTDSDGSSYCEGEFVVPLGYNGDMKVTVVGAGGGGGVAGSAGYTEYTNAGGTNNFTVPALVNELESTLISGGAGGGAGGQVRVNHTFVTNGNGNVTKNSTNLLTVASNGQVEYTPADVLKGKRYLVTACGGGGGGGGKSVWSGGGGGTGGYFVDRVAPSTAPTSGTIPINLGGGGGGGGGDNTAGRDGRKWDGGAGGSGINYITKSGNQDGTGGTGGYVTDDKYGYGGGGGTHNGSKGQDGIFSVSTTDIVGGAGAGGGGKGGNVPGNGSEGPASGAGGGGGEYMGGGGGGGTGGSGGGGGGQTVIRTFLGQANMTAAGGGGGGGGAAYDGSTLSNYGAGGGGGGGIGGGAGGKGGGASQHGYPGKGGTGGASKTYPDLLGATISTIFGSNYCNGGNGGNGGDYATGSDGKDGAMRISYLSYGTGGSGGGSGKIFANYLTKVIPNEILKVIIGVGGPGGKAGQINSSGSIVQPVESSCSYLGSTYMLRSDNTLLFGNKDGCGHGGRPGSSTGKACGTGNGDLTSESAWIFWNGGGAYPVNGGHSSKVPDGFFSVNARPAGDGAAINCDASSIATETVGGRGGTTTTPYTGTCTPGAGGTKTSPNGKNAAGYGCGGGGGYGLSNGGNGSGGYARLAWNQNWDNAAQAYKLAEIGTAGGGASGNIATYTVSVKSGDRIKIRIGKGGDGAYVNNNVVIDAKKGGDTVFGYGKALIQIIAGGGGGGKNSSVAGSFPNTSIANGAGGSASGIYSYAGGNIIVACTDSKNTNCYIKGENGSSGNNTTGGTGATLIKSILLGNNRTDNSGGKGGITGDNANGNNAGGYGSGGGGAGILNVGKPSVSTYNPNTGGNGSNGKIVLEWWE